MKNSAPEKWEYREHTRVKHILLEKYLVAWIPILGKWNPKICYFDCFAGKGEYSDGTLGSPLIALKVADNKSSYFGKLICLFIEKDKDNFDNLERVLEREKSSIKSWQGGKIGVGTENDEFAHVVEDVFKYLEEKKGGLAPSFFFIDPFGFSGVPFTIIQRILSNRQTEVFFTFMVQAITRFFRLPNLENKFNELFGTDEWKDLINSSEPEIALIELYRKQLHESANVKYSWSFRNCTSEKVQSLYYLIHATNNRKGHYVMKDIMFSQSAQGNFAYLGPQDTFARTQMRLFSIQDIEELKKYLLERFEGITIEYNAILEEVCTPWYSEPPYIEKHYRQALKELEQEKKVKIDRITSKTPKGLSGQDKITFFKSQTSFIQSCIILYARDRG